MQQIKKLQTGIENVQEYERQKKEFAKTLTYVCDKKRHLICIPYTFPNLHIMADDLGIGRYWFDKDHYDIPVNRIEEINKKCIVTSPKKIVGIIKEANNGNFRGKKK